MEQTQTAKYDRESLLSVFILLILTWGFYRSYIMFFPSFKGFQFVHHFHGAIMLAWMGCLIVQPLLISRKKYTIHKTIGKISFVLAPILILSLYLVARMSFSRNLSAPSGTMEEAVAVMALNVPPLFVFSALYLLAIANKRRTYYHMRFMIGTALLMIGPGLGRGLIIYFGVSFPLSVSITLAAIALVSVGLLGIDLYKKRDYLPNLIVAGLLLLESVLWEVRYLGVWQEPGTVLSRVFLI